MKIYKLSNVLTIPFAALLLYFASYFFDDSKDLIAAWAIVPLSTLILIYLFQPQIDYWWLSKRPFAVDENVLKLVSKTNENYNKLNEGEKAEFEKRLILYVNGRSFLAKGMENDTEVPYDIKYMIAQIPISLSLKERDFLIKAFDRVVLYKHAFPSPGYRFLHTVETHAEDGVILFSLEHAEAAFFNPTHFYNVAWHAFAEAYIKARPKIDFPIIENEDWQKVENISGFQQEQIINTVGYKEFDLLVTVIVCYFVNRERFVELWPC